MKSNEERERERAKENLFYITILKYILYHVIYFLFKYFFYFLNILKIFFINRREKIIK